MPAKTHNQFGLSGQDYYDYNYFLGRGKKRKKRKGHLRAALSRNQNRSAVPAVQSTTAPVPPPTPFQTINTSAATTSSAVNNQTVQTPPPAGQEAALNSNPEVLVNVDQVTGDQVAEGAEMENTAEESEEQYSNFLGFGKKAKEKRKLKNEERKAATERTRAETQLMLSGSAPSTASSASASSATPQATPQQASAPEDTGTPQEEQLKGSEKKGPNMTMILVIVAGVVIVVGAGILMVTSKKQPTQKIAAPAS